MEDVITHAALDGELVHDLLGLGGRVTEGAVARDILVEAENAGAERVLVLVLGLGADDGLKGGRGGVLGRLDLGHEGVKQRAGLVAQGLGVGHDALLGAREERRGLGRVRVLGHVDGWGVGEERALSRVGQGAQS